MTNNQNISPKAPDHLVDAAIASIWSLLLTVFIGIEVGSLLISRSMLAAVLH